MIVHGTFDPLPAETRHKVLDLLATGQQGAYRARSRTEMELFVEGLEVVEPGIVSSVEWRPDPANPPETSVADAMCYVVVARKP